MKIKDIKPNQKKIAIKGKVIEKSKIRDLGDNQVINVLFDDDTGRCDVAIYKSACKDFDKIEVGDKLLVVDSLSSKKEDGNLKISTGRYGRVYIR